jgi:uncharacterized protein
MHMIKALDDLPDGVAAAAFRRLVLHLRHREDAANIDLMGLAGFCRNCLSDWVAEAGDMPRDAARDAIYGEPYADFKARQPEATQAQIDAMAASVAKNG